MQPIRIGQVRATAVSIPAVRTCAWSLGRTRGFTRVIVEVESEDGLVGLGDAPGAAAAEVITKRFVPAIVGLPVDEIASVRHACLRTRHDFGHLADPAGATAFGAVEIALWDLIGKSRGRPVFRLLGGPARPRAGFVAYAYSVATEDGHPLSDIPGILAAFAAEAIARTGASTFEFKIGRHPVDIDIATVKAVRAALGPDIDIAVDANLAMPMHEARRFLAAVRPEDLANVEELVSGLADMERLRHDFGVPCSTHCTDPEKLMAYPAIDNVVGGIDLDGGISGVVRMATVARALGRGFWLRSGGETGIGTAAMAHLGVAVQALERPSQTLIDWLEDDLILGEPWPVRDGGMHVPDTPGLGVELDRAALDHYADIYRQQGAFTLFDQP